MGFSVYCFKNVYILGDQRRTVDYKCTHCCQMGEEEGNYLSSFTDCFSLYSSHSPTFFCLFLIYLPGTFPSYLHPGASSLDLYLYMCMYSSLTSVPRSSMTYYVDLSPISNFNPHPSHQLRLSFLISLILQSLILSRSSILRHSNMFFVISILAH